MWYTIGWSSSMICAREENDPKKKNKQAWIKRIANHQFRRSSTHSQSSTDRSAQRIVDNENNDLWTAVTLRTCTIQNCITVADTVVDTQWAHEPMIDNKQAMKKRHFSVPQNVRLPKLNSWPLVDCMRNAFHGINLIFRYLMARRCRLTVQCRME